MSLAYLVAQIPGQPIIVAWLTADMGLGDNDAFYREFADLAAQFEGPYYRIIDMTEMRLSPEESLLALSATVTGVPGSASDPRVVKNFYIGLGDHARLIRARLEQQPASACTMIFVDSLEHALNIIYAEMERDNDAQGET